MTPRTGRPRLDNPRTETVRFRLTAEELKAVEDRAAAAGLSVTDYARAVALGKRPRKAD